MERGIYPRHIVWESAAHRGRSSHQSALERDHFIKDGRAFQSRLVTSFSASGARTARQLPYSEISIIIPVPLTSVIFCYRGSYYAQAPNSIPAMHHMYRLDARLHGLLCYHHVGRFENNRPRLHNLALESCPPAAIAPSTLSYDSLFNVRWGSVLRIKT